MQAAARAIVLGLVIGVCGCGQHAPETLAIGTSAPAFSLPGTDDKTHSLTEYANSAILAVIFTCNHCPVSELYEARIQQLYADYRSRGVAVVAINPDSAKTIPVTELSYSDEPDTPAGMKARAAYRRLEYPYLYDGDGQTAAAAFKVVALPQAFVFDSARKLRYVGRIDDNVRADQVAHRNLREAIDDLLAAQPVRVATTAVDGCPIKRLGASTDVEREQAAIQSAAVTLQLVGPAELKTLRANATSHFTLVNFWATWCPPCLIELPDLQTTYRMYRARQMDFVTVSIDAPVARTMVMKLLQEQHASSVNRLFESDDTAALQDAFDPAVPAAVPFTLLLAPNGDVVHQQAGEVNFQTLRRAILANLPDDPKYPGLQAYWARPQEER